jgi:cell division protein FtsW
MTEQKVDKKFFILTGILLFIGILTFYSAVLGFASKDNLEYSRMIFSQFIGLLGGITLGFVIFSIKYTFFRKISPYLFVFSLILMFFVFVPGIGYEHNGARRWIDLFGMSFQPIELLKVSTILFFSAWIAKFQKRNEKTKFGTMSLAAIVGLASIPVILQPDFDGVLLLIIPLVSILLVSKAPLKQLFLFGTIATFVLVTMIFSIDHLSHVKKRIVSYANPQSYGEGGNYQVRQSLIAIGSGQINGKGYGQSVQKYGFLPEPAGDSVFAIFAEEWGFLGSLFLVILYTLWILSGYKIAQQVKDNFSKYFITGSITLLGFQSFVNMASMSGIIPVVGMPLVFVSQGGTSLLINICIASLILNMSQYKK